eukprot:scaffold2534_cov176-Alexandrium_tamarense.AAC.6
MIGYATHPHSEPNTMSFASHAMSQTNAGAKRSLASCREDLERSWQLSSDEPSPSSQIAHSISNSSDSLDNDDGMGRYRYKRQRTVEPEEVEMKVDEAMMDTTTITSFSRIRITPDNRPPKRTPSNLPQSQNNNNNVTPNASVKAGWYQGQVDAFNNRHGLGTTKHDDGTEYQGQYVHDSIHGQGRYTFVPLHQLVPNPSHTVDPRYDANLLRQTERVHEGLYRCDIPHGGGTTTTKIVDSVPFPSNSQGWTSSGIDIKHVQVIQDVGFHKAEKHGCAVGEGIRFIFTRNGSEGWEESCIRLYNGESTGVNVARDYGIWVCSCLGVDVPTAPTSL